MTFSAFAKVKHKVAASNWLFHLIDIKGSVQQKGRGFLTGMKLGMRLFFVLFIKETLSLQSKIKCDLANSEHVTGRSGQIDSLDRKTVTCPDWYQSWQGYEKCYPPEEFIWCWNVKPECTKTRVKFNRFAVEEQSRVMQNYFGFQGEDACLDTVKGNVLKKSIRKREIYCKSLPE